MKKLKSFLISGISFVILFIIPLYSVIEQELMDDIDEIMEQRKCSESEACSILKNRIKGKIHRIRIQMEQTLKTKIYVWYLNQKLKVL
jgi:hypothetical protein